MILYIVGADVSLYSGIPHYRNELRHDLLFLPLEDEGKIMWKKEQHFANKKPNLCHKHIVDEADFVITQNLDCLLELAGLPDDRILHVFGRVGMPVQVGQSFDELPSKVVLIGLTNDDGLGPYLDYDCPYYSENVTDWLR